MHNFPVVLLSKDHVVFEGLAASVTIPSVKGQLTLLKDHIPIVGTMAAGDVTLAIASDSKVDIKSFPVVGGYFEMSEQLCSIFMTV